MVKSPSVQCGNAWARNHFPLRDCDGCGATRTERHHVDGNPMNNDGANIAILCRKCHGKAHSLMNKTGSPVVFWRSDVAESRWLICSACGYKWPSLIKGRCRRCYFAGRFGPLPVDVRTVVSGEPIVIPPRGRPGFLPKHPPAHVVQTFTDLGSSAKAAEVLGLSRRRVLQILQEARKAQAKPEAGK